METIKVRDLDVRICDYYNDSDNEETFREFIRDSEIEFGMEHKNIDRMSKERLNEYLDFLDELWGK